MHSPILQYDAAVDALVPWFWPINVHGERVTPSDLNDHRISHQFHAPRCFCTDSASAKVSNESVIYQVPMGYQSGEYVAACAEGKCDYLVSLERMYAGFGLPVKCYPPHMNSDKCKGLNEIKSESANAIAKKSQSVHEPTRSQQQVDVLSIPTPGHCPPEELPSEDPFDLLWQLDELFRPGLTERQFRSLFSRCSCGLIMTRRSFEQHECIQKSDSI